MELILNTPKKDVLGTPIERDGVWDWKVAFESWECPEPVYPNWSQWLVSIGVIPKEIDNSQFRAIIELGLINPIPADIAEKLGLQSKGEGRGT